MGEGIFTQQEKPMGYRSQVLLVIDKDLVSHFMVATSASPKAQALCFQEADIFQEDYDGAGSMLFYWSEIKWYANQYSEIDIIERFVGDLESGESVEDSYVKFRFIKIGEEYDDITDTGNGFWDIGINREINF